MKSYIILFLVFLRITSSINAQTILYDITSKNKQLGQVNVTKTEDNGIVKIDVNSEMTVSLFMKIDLKYTLTANYKDNRLISSSVTTFVNGHLHSSCVIEKKDEYYSITKDEHLSEYSGEIIYSGALLYWNEPKDVSTVYSEIDNIKKPIKNVGFNEYNLTDPKSGHISDYYYSKGLLDKAVIRHTLMNFELTRR